MFENDFFNIEPSWKKILREELKQPYLLDLAAFLAKERSSAAPIYPPQELVSNAFWKTPYDKVKVVIVGQDPYHAPGQAHGLAFSVPKDIRIPPSLRNIFKELSTDLHIPFPSHGCLNQWAEEGVFLLNATLTVREGQPMSHYKKGWERFTDAVIEKLGQQEEPLVFVLWGKLAQEKGVKLEGSPHKILKATHPSPLSANRGFFGCRHFSQIQTFLASTGRKEIDWTLN